MPTAFDLLIAIFLGGFAVYIRKDDMGVVGIILTFVGVVGFMLVALSLGDYLPLHTLDLH